MSALALQWRRPSRPLGLRWRGLDDEIISAIAEQPMPRLAALVGPAGSNAAPADPGDLTVYFDNALI
jgi:hypothetical protein